MSRYWMPCLDSQADPCGWDIELAISTEIIDPDLVEKLHAVASGVLYRQVCFDFCIIY